MVEKDKPTDSVTLKKPSYWWGPLAMSTPIVEHINLKMNSYINYSNDSDKILLNSIAGRDPDALVELYNRHAQPIYNMIMSIVHDHIVADDLLQETFWQVWRKAETYRGDGTVIGWLFRIARNKSLDLLRRQKRRPKALIVRTQAAEEEVWAMLSVESKVERLTNRTFTHKHLHQALDSIPIEQRLCLELAYFEGMTQSQIAAHIQIPVGTVKTRTRLGLEKLKRFLSGVGYSRENIAS